MWEWFLPAAERHKYYSNIMEGPHGGGGPIDPKAVGWMWGFLYGAGVTTVAGFVLWLVKG